MSMKTRALPVASQLCRYSGFNLMCRPVYGGLGMILMFHRFTSVPEKRIDASSSISSKAFDRLLGYIRKKDRKSSPCGMSRAPLRKDGISYP